MRRSRLLATPVALVALALAAACGTNGKSTANNHVATVPAAPVATGAAATPIAGATTVTVTLSEYSVQLDTATIPAGPVHFVVKNSGQRAHQFQVYPLAAISGGHTMAMNSSGPITGAIGFLQLIPAGSSAVLDVTLTPGAWELACHLQDSENGSAFDHYDKGMKADATVR